MSDKIHRRVAEVLGMSMDEQDEDYDLSILEDQIEDDEDGIVPVPLPTVIEEPVDNPELPALQNEMARLEHGQLQTERLLERGIHAVEKTLIEIPMISHQYKPRVIEAAAALFKAVADLTQHKVDVQIKLTELKMKQAAFSRNKSSTGSLGSNNTFVISREELIKSYEAKNPKAATIKKSQDDTDK